MIFLWGSIMKNIFFGCWFLCLFFSSPAFANLKYNNVQQKSSHNSYGRDEGLLDQLTFHHLRSVELDIYKGKIGRPNRNDNWYVYHTPVVDTRTNCDQLTDCLALFKIFDEEVPNHEVVTVWIDAKDGFSGSHNEAKFDELVTRYLSRDDILQPADLYRACPSAGKLKDTVSLGCHWPTLSSLKGKWIFVFASGGYNTTRENRIAFRAQNVSSTGDVDRASSIFFNTDSPSNSLSNYIYNLDFISRRYVLDDRNGFEQAINGKVHHIATNKVNFLKDNWSKTHTTGNLVAWPFKCIGGCGNPREYGNTIGVEVNSEDIWGRNDHFTFLYQNRGTRHSRYQASIHVASSHVDRWAKGCLMARVSLASNSPYFAVCRPSDNSQIRVQWRDGYSSNSSYVEKNISLSAAPGAELSDAAYVKFDTWREGECAVASGSLDGKVWTKIASRCFNEVLKYQGMAASSHGNSHVRYLFNNMTLWGETQRLGNFTRKNIGTVRHVKTAEGQP